MTEKVLRQVFQKVNQADNDWNPSASDGIKYIFGSEGIYTKMFSGLNLEEDLLIGGEKQVSYETGQNFIITEKYFLNNNENVYYKLETSINNKIIRFLINDNNDFLVSSDTDGSFLIFEDKKRNFNDSIITVKLFTVKENTIIQNEEEIIVPEEVLIREKQIIFSEVDGKKVILEKLLQ